MLLNGLVFAQLAVTLFTGALYDGGGDTQHPFFHLAVGARVEYGAIGIEGVASSGVVRGIRDVYIVRVVGKWSRGRVGVLGGVGYSLWRVWLNDSKPHKEAEGLSPTIGLRYDVDPAVLDLKLELFPYNDAPIGIGLLLSLGLRIV